MSFTDRRVLKMHLDQFLKTVVVLPAELLLELGPGVLLVTVTVFV
jgi:hypothetical protein